MKFTVAVCTWNRAGLLAKTLEHMKRLQLPQDVEWELIVVNNNSSDRTDEVIESYRRALPVRRLFEVRQGLSHARNHAVASASGDYIVWTDDDVLVDPKWLMAYREAFIRHPDASVFGGPVLPWFERRPPSWLTAHWEWMSDALAMRNFGAVEFELRAGDGRIPYGANYALKISVQKEYAYDPGLGVKGKVRRPGEETSVITKILQDGHTGWWVPQARVQHWIPASRTTLKSFMSHYFNLGKYTIITHEMDHSPVRWGGKPRWLYTQCVLDLLMAASWAMRTRREEAVYRLLRGVYKIGRIFSSPYIEI